MNLLSYSSVFSVACYILLSLFVSFINSQFPRRGMAGGQNNKGYLPPGYARIDGEVVDMANKLIQRVGGMGGGTQYFAWSSQNGPVVFRRREVDSGRRFIVFPDHNYPLGDGHYVVLRRFKHGKGVRRGGTIYEAFYMDLGDSINAMVTNYNTLSPAASNSLGIRGASGGGLRGTRVKRMIHYEDELSLA